MNNDTNSITLIGRLVRDPETKYTPTGVAITKFSIANNETFTQNNEKKEHVNFFDIVVWGNQAINCEKYLKKGSLVAISGRLKQNRWTDQNGQNKSKLEITAQSVQFLSTKNQQGQDQQAQQQKFDDPWKD